MYVKALASNLRLQSKHINLFKFRKKYNLTALRKYQNL